MSVVDLLMTEGFDHFTDWTAKGWISQGGGYYSNPVVSAAYRRGTQGQGFRIGGSGFVAVISKLIPRGPHQTICFANAFRPFSTDRDNPPSCVFSFRDGTTHQFEVRVANNGDLVIARNGTILATAATVCPVGQWSQLNGRLTIGDAPTGAFKAFLNGDMSTPVFNLTGIDTKNTGNASCNYFYLGHSVDNTNRTIDHDDIALYLGSGDDTDFFGDSKIITPRPSSDSVAQMTRSAGAANFETQDENPMSTADYVSSATVGQEDLYGHSGIPLNGRVLAAILNHYADKSDAGSRSFAARVRQGATDVQGDDIALTASATTYQTPFMVDPVTGLEMTPTQLNSLLIGAKITV